jgi:magnesium transporter
MPDERLCLARLRHQLRGLRPQRRRRDITLDEISDVLAVDDGSFVWVGHVRAGGSMLDKLQEEFGLHDLAIEDAQHAHQRPKIEAYGDSLFVVDAHRAGGRGHISFGEDVCRSSGPRTW